VPDLRTLLDDLAGPAAAEPDLAALRSGAARRARHRRAGIVGGAAVLAAVVIGGAVTIADQTGSSSDDGRSPVDTIDVGPDPTATTDGPTPSEPTPTTPGSTPTAEGDAAASGWLPMAAAPIVARGQAASAWTGTELIIWGGRSVEGELADGAAYDPATDTWRTIAPAPDGVAGPAVAAWTGERVAVVTTGGFDRFATYDVASDTWTDATIPAYDTTRLIWTGSSLVAVGSRHSGSSNNPGPVVARYEEGDGRWQEIPAPEGALPGTRSAWTGAEVVLWDGVTTWAVDPVAETWRDLGAPPVTASRLGWIAASDEAVMLGPSSPGGPAFVRPIPDGAWAPVGTEVPAFPAAIAGGLHPSAGGALALTTDGQTWVGHVSLTMWGRHPDLPEPRIGAVMALVGDRIVVWSGVPDAGPSGHGWILDPAAPQIGSDEGAEPLAWEPIAEAPLSPRSKPIGTWTGTELVVWGGVTTAGPAQGGAAYDPATDTWRTLSSAGMPAGIGEGTAVWTGQQVVVAAEAAVDGQLVVGRYDPDIDRWLTTSPPPLPGPRDEPGVAWTGDEILVIGGSPVPGSDDVPTPTGAAYDPTFDRWRPLPEPPDPGALLPGTWAAGRYVAWPRLGDQTRRPGDRSQLLALSPGAEAWEVLVPPSDAAPGPVVWLGGEILTWRACDTGCPGLAVDPDTGAVRELAPSPFDPQFSPLVPTGGTVSVVELGSLRTRRYDPSADRWDVLPQLDPPRCCPTVVWTGDELLAWGGALGAAVDTGAGLRVPSAPIPPASDAPVLVELPSGTIFSWDGGRVWLGTGCGGDTVVPSCGERGAVEILGLDLATAPGAQTDGGFTWTEDATLIGDLDVAARTLTVVDVRERDTTATTNDPIARPADCPALAAGEATASPAAIAAWGGAHPDVYGGQWSADGGRLPVVQLTDLAVAASLADEVPGRHCVDLVEHTVVQLRAWDAAMEQRRDLLVDTDGWITGYGGTENADQRARFFVVFDDPATVEIVARVAGDAPYELVPLLRRLE
jgi:hypothetical protein